MQNKCSPIVFLRSLHDVQYKCSTLWERMGTPGKKYFDFECNHCASPVSPLRPTCETWFQLPIWNCVDCRTSWTIQCVDHPWLIFMSVTFSPAVTGQVSFRRVSGVITRRACLLWKECHQNNAVPKLPRRFIGLLHRQKCIRTLNFHPTRNIGGCDLFDTQKTDHIAVLLIGESCRSNRGFYTTTEASRNVNTSCWRLPATIKATSCSVAN